MIFAIIPARGGSKRIPKKNIKSFYGKPIICRSIDVAFKTKLFDRIIVSTDDEEIAKVAENCGAYVPFRRPKEISDDYTGTNEVVKHSIKWLEGNGYHADYVCCIYATAPLMQAKYIKKGFDLLLKTNSEYSFSITRYSFPIQRALRRYDDGRIDALHPENINSRSQDFEDAYHDAGQFYWGKTGAFLNDKVLYSQNSTPVILPSYFVQDIDTVEDWKRAEAMYQVLKATGEIQ